MCLRPLTIDLSKRSRYFVYGTVLPKEVQVPCGRCWQCQMTARNELLLRIKSEYDACIGKEGKVAFVTFTYSEETVPCFTYSLEKSYSEAEGKELNVSFTPVSRESVLRGDYGSRFLFGFNKLHFRNFMKVIRQTLARYGYAGSLRYIVVSEYGTDPRYTQRPHYHALFFLDSSCLKVLSDNNIDFLSFCAKYWNYGKVSASEKGLYLVGSQGCDYIAKYVTKSEELLKLRHFKQFFNWLEEVHSIYSKKGFHFPLFVKPKTYFYKILRKNGMSYFVLKSLFFGQKISDDLIKDSLNTTELLSKIAHGIDIVKYGETKQLPYPRYNLRKLFYENRSDGSYMLSPLGADVFVDRSIQSLNDSVRSVRDWIDSTADFFNNSDARFDRAALGIMRTHVFKLMFYNKYIRGRYFPNYYYYLISQYLEDIELVAHTDPSPFPYIIERLSENEIYDVCSDIRSKDSFHINELISRDPLSPYENYGVIQNAEYDFIIDNYYKCRAYVEYLKLKEYDARNRDMKCLKDVFNSSKYK